MKRSELKRKTPLKRSTKSRKPTVHRYWRDAREKVEREAVCRYCGAQTGLESAHTIGREFDDAMHEHDEFSTYGSAKTFSVDSVSIYVNPDSIVPLCNFTANDCHGKFDRHEIDLLGKLTVDEECDAVRRAGSLELARVRLAPSAYESKVAA